MNSQGKSNAGQQEVIVATRVLKLRRPDGYVDLPVHIFVPKKREKNGQVVLKSDGREPRSRLM